MARAPKIAAGCDLGFEAELFKAANKLRGNMEPSDYEHVALGLIFLKHISEGFEARHAPIGVSVAIYRLRIPRAFNACRTA